MTPNVPEKIPTTLDVYRHPTCGDLPARLDCPACGVTLNIHQPDVGSPDRLLGVCTPCRRWYLIDEGRGCGGGALALLPGPDWLRDIAGAGPA